MQDTFLKSEEKDKFDIFKLALSIVICLVTLIVSSNLSTLIYVYLSGKKLSNSGELIAFFGKNTYFFLQLIPFVFAALALALCIKFIHKSSIKVYITSRRHFSWKRFFLSFTLWFGIMFLVLMVQFASKNEIHFNFNSSFFYLLLISLLFVSIQAAFEEFLFRGFILRQIFNGTHNRWISIGISSLFFGLMHYNNPEIAHLGKIILVYIIFTGIFLSLLSVLDQGLELAIGFHVANNMFASLILTSNWQVFQTDALWIDFAPPALSWDLLLNLVLFFPFLIFLYARIFKWDFGSIFAKFVKKSKQ